LQGCCWRPGGRRLEGIYHLAGAERISRYDFACRLADIFELDRGLIVPGRMADLCWKARRPKDSSLDVGKASRLLEERSWGIGRSFEVLKEEMM